MPGFTTHYLFGIKTFQNLLNGTLKNIIKKHSSAYLMGLQGPDIFFFYLPYLMGDKSKNVGSLMHVSKVEEFFHQYVEELECIIQENPVYTSLPSSMKYHLETALSYFAGFICHYTLDYISHPFIYSNSDFHLNNADQLYYANHRSLETRIDTLMLRKLKKMEPSNFSRYSAIPKNQSEANLLALLLCRCINKVYYQKSSSQISPKMIKNVFLSARMECHFLDDRTGLKRKVVRAIENKTLKYNLLSSLMSIDHIIDTKNDLNLSHKIWASPWQPNLKQTSSFPELFYQALLTCGHSLKILEEFEDKLSIFSESLHSKKIQLLNNLGNYSYHSGLDCNREQR